MWGKTPTSRRRIYKKSNKISDLTGLFFSSMGISIFQKYQFNLRMALQTVMGILLRLKMRFADIVGGAKRLIFKK